MILVITKIIGYRIVKIHTNSFSFKDLNEDEVSTLIESPKALAISLRSQVRINAKESLLAIDAYSEFRKSED